MPVQSIGTQFPREYRIWKLMRSRCDNPNLNHSHRYHHRGIRYCERWNSFAAFLADMGPAPDKYTLERKDNDAGYCKENCRWATRKEQSRNTHANRTVTIDGVTRCIAEWAEVLAIDAKTLGARLRRGWPIEEALTGKSFAGRPRVPPERNMEGKFCGTQKGMAESLTA